MLNYDHNILRLLLVISTYKEQAVVDYKEAFGTPNYAWLQHYWFSLPSRTSPRTRGSLGTRHGAAFGARYRCNVLYLTLCSAARPGHSGGYRGNRGRWTVTHNKQLSTIIIRVDRIKH